MFFHMEDVVYIYIGVCSCMLLFNILLIFIRKSEDRVSNIHIRYFTKMIEENEKNPEKILYRRLRRVGQFRAFHAAITALMEKDRKKVEKFLQNCKPVFIRLSQVYSLKDDMYKAYFAYVMSLYKICGEADNNAVIEMMRKLIHSKSAYCRENALKALYSFGNEKNVYYALKEMNDNDIFHHSKLITDGMITFCGDHQLLASMLWDNLSEFGVEYQTSFIQYIRVVSGSYRTKFYQLLLKPGTDKEVKIVLVRYFAKYHYRPVKELLFQYLKAATNFDWELAAVSATVLRDYNGQDVIEVLMEALSHANWYIRYNAAESLQYKNVSFQELSSIYNGNNRYAREMLEFQRQKNKIKQQITTEKVAI